ncbi:DUF3037 domain-containing protein [Deinococcus sp. 12RED42]|uniref:DUF3037 domain-containing protein n=1 Tax=Deinococcus sp. 12RED42 TaxID=2745872 RepID=UPI001E6179BF|nr:DUF3037 domain-containing protein [Deinococcus sp. 12RED42]MCD0164451.1 DUF3037 domain-containing protein [Deinococcus sp. 12RED42]
MPIKAHFSLVQFVPDQVRDERINVAVIMQVPQLNYVGIRVRPRMDKALRQLWPEVDAQLIRSMVRAIEADVKPLEREPRQLDMETMLPLEKASLEYLSRFTQHYGPIKLTEPKPTRIRDGMTLREKLDQLFNVYVRVEGSPREVHNVTKEVLQDHLTRALDARNIVYQHNYIIKGQYFPNKFDISKPRIDNPNSIVQVISFDNEKVDQPIFQCQRLIQAVHDVFEADPRAADTLEFAVALQAPIHYPDHRSEYENALRAIRRTENFQIFQNYGAEDTMTPQIVDRLSGPSIRAG